MLRHAKQLENYQLRSREGELGRVEDFFFDDQHWMVRYLAIDTGAWLNNRRVLISPAAVSRTEWNERTITVNLTHEQVRNSPSIDTARPLSREQEAALIQYY